MEGPMPVSPGVPGATTTYAAGRLLGSLPALLPGRPLVRRWGGRDGGAAQGVGGAATGGNPERVPGALRAGAHYSRRHHQRTGRRVRLPLPWAARLGRGAGGAAPAGAGAHHRAGGALRRVARQSVAGLAAGHAPPGGGGAAGRRRPLARERGGAALGGSGDRRGGGGGRAGAAGQPGRRAAAERGGGRDAAAPRGAGVSLGRLLLLLFTANLIT